MPGGTAVAGRLELSDRRLGAAVFGVLFPLMLLTASWSLPYHIDPLTNVFTSATIARTGSPILTSYEVLAAPEAFGVLGWVVDSPRGPVSQYPPGTAVFAAPAYLLAGEGSVETMSGSNAPDLAGVRVRIPPLWPAAVAAALATAAAAAALALALHPLVGTRWAGAAGLVVATGTGLWLNGSHELWQHGVASFWIAVGLLAVSRARWLPAGLALGVGVLTRPTVALVAAGLGAWILLQDRRWRPALGYGLGVAAGVASLLTYNYWLWGEITVSGGYSSAFVARLGGADLLWYLENLAGALFSLDRGLLVWSPFLAVAAFGLPSVWRSLPTWSQGALFGGALLLLVQFRLNRYSGGSGFFSYRYPLEAVMAGAPALAVAAREVWHRSPWSRRLLLYATTWSVVVHTVMVVIEIRGAA